MPLFLEWVLVGWSLLSACWWGVAIGLVSSGGRGPRWPGSGSGKPEKQSGSTLSIFKPVPPLRGSAISPELVGALESFVSQLDKDMEMLLGIEETDAANWKRILERWQRVYPEARLNVIVMPRPSRFHSPKVSWFYSLARWAQGEEWMWSDADVIAPPGSLEAIRREFSESNAGMLTCPYVVQGVEHVPMMLEALFANVEFYPGVLFCAAMGPVQFGLGAAMVFSAARFRERARWEELGARMADDNALGHALAPVRISGTTFATVAAESSWREAVQHYFRWQKTIRWCEPIGSAGQIVIVPVVGWLAAALVHPGSMVVWLGLFVTTQIEVLAATVLFWLIGCEVRSWWVVSSWSLLLRPLAWLTCWIPWPVVFRSQNRKWWSLYRSAPLEGKP